MKYFAILALIFSLESFAQIVSGGGGIIDPHLSRSRSFLPETKEGHAGIFIDQEKNLNSFLNSLSEQRFLCSVSTESHMSFNERDFLQAYFKLAVFIDSLKSADKCNEVRTYTKCLYTSLVEKNLTRVVRDPKMTKYLEKKYKISNKEANVTLTFFKKLKEACGKESCEM